MQHIFIGKSLFFPEQKILAIGDLQNIINEIKKRDYKLKKIIFLGDIKHYFNYEWKEKFNFDKILYFLRGFVKDSDIILIKGNHDKFDFSGKEMKNYYFNNGIMFFHGHMTFPQIFESRVSTWVFGHLHPSVSLADKSNIKREKYKCFLLGSYKEKEVIVVPSFFGIIEGTPVNEEGYEREGFSVIPNSELRNFEVHAINDNGEIFDFGKVKKLM